MIPFKQFMLEYITDPLRYFRDYINMPDDEKAVDAAYTFFSPESYQEFRDELNEYSDDDEESDEEVEEVEEVEQIDDLDQEQIQAYGDWLMSDGGDRIRSEYGDSEAPSWMFFYDATIVKNSWLIHISDHVSDIISDGFTYGTENVAELGLTTYVSMHHKKQKASDTFYAFSFTPRNFKQYWDGRKYGRDFVIFMSSGVNAFHNGDEEEQTLFIAKEASHFVPVYNRDGDYVVEDKRTGRVVFKSERPSTVVDWVIANFPQYRSTIVQRDRNVQ